ncbi:MAG: hypothetical protein J7K89_01790 [Candidatus Cloacimonetes bacterium]|nr:hypothetical protein [Candidatus Cloacimonadota bacterium]
MKQFYITLLLCVIGVTLMAGEITAIGSHDDYMIYNKTNSKIVRYLELKPQASVTFHTVNINSIDVLTRLVMPSNKGVEYRYEIAFDGTRKKITKTARTSRTSQGVNGETISKYNKLCQAIPRNNKQVTIINTSAYTLLVKINSTEISRSTRTIDYVAYSPDVYDADTVLKLNGREFTYYHGGKISLTLEGPIYLKVFSRLLFDNSYTPSMHYAFNVYDNNTLLRAYTEKAHKSRNTCLVGDATIIPSTADINIIRLDAGTHHIRIEDGAINRNVIFKFYISKSAVEIESK